MLKVRKEEKTVTIKEYVRMKGFRISEHTVRRRIRAGLLRVKQDAPRCRIEIIL